MKFNMTMVGIGIVLGFAVMWMWQEKEMCKAGGLCSECKTKCQVTG